MSTELLLTGVNFEIYLTSGVIFVNKAFEFLKSMFSS